MMITKAPLEIPDEVIESFCRKWKIEELALFGSILRGDFSSDSDVDVLATFAADAEWSVFDHARMREELSALLRREVDVVEKSTLNNPFRRREILTTRKIIYAV
jgi:predicted nucleotidyltransferase